MNGLFLLLFIIGFAAAGVRAEAVRLSKDGQNILDTRFRSWKIAEIDSGIVEYFRQNRSFEKPNLIKGDWNGDGRTDYAVLLQNRKIAEKRITVVLMKNKSGYKTYVLDANDCLMSVKKGKRDYDFEARKTFRYRTDAIFSYIWEKAGVSYVWNNGKFRMIATSD